MKTSSLRHRTIAVIVLLAVILPPAAPWALVHAAGLPAPALPAKPGATYSTGQGDTQGLPRPAAHPLVQGQAVAGLSERYVEDRTIADFNGGDFFHTALAQRGDGAVQLLPIGLGQPWQPGNNDGLPPRAGLAAVYANGYLYAIAGDEAYGSTRNEVFYARVYTDVLTSTGRLSNWQPTTPLPTSLYPDGLWQHDAVAMVFTDTQKAFVYVFGGIKYAPPPAVYNNVVYAEVLPDGTLGTWQETIPLPTALFGHEGLALNGTLYVLGGANAMGNSHRTVYYAQPDHATGAIAAWSQTTAPLPDPGSGGYLQVAASTSQGRIYVYGGASGVVMPTYSYAVHFAQPSVGGDIVAWWYNLETLPTNSYASEGAAYESGLLLAVAGAWGCGSSSCTPSGDVQVSLVDGATGQSGPWYATAGVAPPRFYHAVVQDADGFLYSIGGASGQMGERFDNVDVALPYSGGAGQKAASLELYAPAGTFTSREMDLRLGGSDPVTLTRLIWQTTITDPAGMSLTLSYRTHGAAGWSGWFGPFASPPGEGVTTTILLSGTADLFQYQALLSSTALPTANVTLQTPWLEAVKVGVLGPCEPAQEADFSWNPAVPEVGQEVAFTGIVGGEKQVEMVSDIGGPWYVGASLALDADGHPHISYFAWGRSAVEYAWSDGMSWYTDTVAAGIGEYAGMTSLALDQVGRPHIVYNAGRWEGNVVYASYDGSTWQLETVGGGAVEGICSGLVLDAADHPHIVYHDWNAMALKYSWHDGTTWHNQVVDNSADVGGSCTLAIGPSGQLHAAYKDWTNGTLKHAWLDGGTWSYEVVEAPGQSGGGFSIAVDSAGRPHLAYCADAYNPAEGCDTVRYARYDGATWLQETLEVAEGSGTGALALDAADRPHLVYYSVPWAGLAHTYFDGSAWQTTALHLVGGTSSAVVDAAGRVHFAFYENASTAVKYARLDAPTPPIAYAWSFGDGSTGSGGTAAHTYTAAGNYTVVMTATNCGTETAVVSHTIAVQPAPCELADADFWWTPFIPPVGAAVTFTATVPSGWWSETVDDAGDVGYWSSLVLDADGHPHIAYVEYYPVAELKYAYYDGTAWYMEALDTGDEKGAYASLALDGQGHPHIAYQYHIPVHGIRYAYYDGSTWNFETLAEGQGARYMSLALDGQDRPHIAYEKNVFSGDEVMYTYYDGSAWQSMSIVRTADDGGTYTHLALDSAGRPHVTYFDTPNGLLKYAYYDGTAWQIEVVERYLGSYGPHDLVLDANDHPHISFYDGIGGDLLYDYHDGGAWHQTRVDTAGDVGGGSSLALDAAGHPHIGYYDAANGDLKYAEYDGTLWHIETVDGYGNTGAQPSLALDASGQPHISSYDMGWGVLRYTRLYAPAVPITFTWSFGDGGAGTGETVSHTYDAAGSYLVVLTATNCGPTPVVVAHQLFTGESFYAAYLPVLYK